MLDENPTRVTLLFHLQEAGLLEHVVEIEETATWIKALDAEGRHVGFINIAIGSF